MLDINLTIVVQLINFVILMLLLKAFLYKPLLDYLDRRSDGIKVDLDEAKRLKKEAQNLKMEQDTLYQKARQKAGTIVREGRKQGDEEKQRIIDEAHKEYQKLLEDGRATIDIELKKARSDLKNNVVEIAMDIAEKVIDREIKAADHTKFIDNAVKKMEQWH